MRCAALIPVGLVLPPQAAAIPAPRPPTQAAAAAANAQGSQQPPLSVVFLLARGGPTGGAGPQPGVPASPAQAPVTPQAPRGRASSSGSGGAGASGGGWGSQVQGGVSEGLREAVQERYSGAHVEASSLCDRDVTKGGAGQGHSVFRACISPGPGPDVTVHDCMSSTRQGLSPCCCPLHRCLSGRMSCC